MTRDNVFCNSDCINVGCIRHMIHLQEVMLEVDPTLVKLKDLSKNCKDYERGVYDSV